MEAVGQGSWRGLVRGGASCVIVRGMYLPFSGWSSVGNEDKNYGSGELLMKSWPFGTDGSRVIV